MLDHTQTDIMTTCVVRCLIRVCGTATRLVSRMKFVVLNTHPVMLTSCVVSDTLYTQCVVCRTLLLVLYIEWYNCMNNVANCRYVNVLLHFDTCHKCRYIFNVSMPFFKFYWNFHFKLFTCWMTSNSYYAFFHTAIPSLFNVVIAG